VRGGAQFVLLMFAVAMAGAVAHAQKRGPASGLGDVQVRSGDLLSTPPRADWPMYNGDYTGRRYSSLTQVTPEGHQIVLRHATAGDAFGGVGAFGDPIYPVSAEAIEPSAACAWTSAAMRQLLETEPRIALNALHFVAGRLHDLQRRYRQVTTERVERRVARAILRLVHDAGRRVDAGVEIDFPVSRQDIAEMTGTTLYTVSRLVSAWEQRGIIRGGRQRIVLVEPHTLAAIAEDLPKPKP